MNGSRVAPPIARIHQTKLYQTARPMIAVLDDQFCVRGSNAHAMHRDKELGAQEAKSAAQIAWREPHLSHESCANSEAAAAASMA